MKMTSSVSITIAPLAEMRLSPIGAIGMKRTGAQKRASGRSHYDHLRAPITVQPITEYVAGSSCFMAHRVRQLAVLR